MNRDHIAGIFFGISIFVFIFGATRFLERVRDTRHEQQAKLDGAINFTYSVCLAAKIPNCPELHEKFLPGDILSSDLLR